MNTVNGNFIEKSIPNPNDATVSIKIGNTDSTMPFADFKEAIAGVTNTNLLPDNEYFNLDMSTGNIFTINLLGDYNNYITLNNAKIGTYILILKNDNIGFSAVYFDTTVYWPGNNYPSFSTDPYTTDIVTLIYDGDIWRGAATLNYFIN